MADRGRPSTYSPEVAESILSRLREGEPLAAICRDEGMPARNTVYDWQAAYPDFAGQFAQARDRGFDAIAEDCLAIVDERPPVDEFGKTDSGYVHWQKNRAEHRLKLLAKWSPKRYGERLSHDHSGTLSLESIVAGNGDGK